MFIVLERSGSSLLLTCVAIQIILKNQFHFTVSNRFVNEKQQYVFSRSKLTYISVIFAVSGICTTGISKSFHLSIDIIDHHFHSSRNFPLTPIHYFDLWNCEYRYYWHFLCICRCKIATIDLSEFNFFFLILLLHLHLKAHSQISKRWCFKKNCSCDKACQVSAL